MSKRATGKNRSLRKPLAPGEEAIDVSGQELEAAVCREFCKGKKTLSEIAKLVGIGRERTFPILQSAARLKRFEYIAPPEIEQTYQLKQRYPDQRFRIVRSRGSLDVAYQTAAWLLQLVREYRKEYVDRKEIHVGFAGGGLLRETARLLSDKLRRASEEFRDVTFIFHAMVAAFNPRDPMNDPNAFFSYFAAEPLLISVRFINLLAPGIVTDDEMRTLRSIQAIKEAYDVAGQLDIIVTSAGAHWDRECSRLCQLYLEYKSSPQSFASLQEAGTIGDVLWRPISHSGPVEIKAGIRAMTLVDLKDLPGLIVKKKKVVLALGPCGTCEGPKGDVLRAVLNWREPHVTHVVADSRTAAEAMANRP
jgi:DNA-binding transcriptional regulator LsrR (DeoR family)